MWNYIEHPKTEKRINVSSLYGQKILKKYIDTMNKLKGGAAPASHHTERLSPKDRTKKILENLKNIECIREYTENMVNPKILGMGTVGSVILSCNVTNFCVAIKIQLISNPTEKELFKKEVQNQIRFSPYAPEVFKHCIDIYDGNTYGIIVMEQIEKELDQYLVKSKKTDELKTLKTQISDILRFLQEERITHGDLALFNIARVKRGDEFRWILIDFDRSSSSVYNPDVDNLRIVLEWYASIRSDGTKRMLKKNVDWIKKHAIPEWKSIGNTTYPSKVGELNTDWVDSYEEYCVKAKILCL